MTYLFRQIDVNSLSPIAMTSEMQHINHCLQQQMLTTEELGDQLLDNGSNQRDSFLPYGPDHEQLSPLHQPTAQQEENLPIGLTHPTVDNSSDSIADESEIAINVSGDSENRKASLVNVNAMLAAIPSMIEGIPDHADPSPKKRFGLRIFNSSKSKNNQSSKKASRKKKGSRTLISRLLQPPCGAIDDII